LAALVSWDAAEVDPAGARELGNTIHKAGQIADFAESISRHRKLGPGDFARALGDCARYLATLRTPEGQQAAEFEKHIRDHAFTIAAGF
jgi:hypothetical protein